MPAHASLRVADRPRAGEPNESEAPSRRRARSGRRREESEAPPPPAFVPFALPQRATALLDSLPPLMAAACGLGMQLGASALHHTAEQHASLTTLGTEVLSLRGICATLARQNASLAHVFAAQLARGGQERADAAAAAANAAQIAHDLEHYDVNGPVPDHGELMPGHHAGRGSGGDSESDDDSDDDGDGDSAVSASEGDACEACLTKEAAAAEGGAGSGGEAGGAANRVAAAATAC